MHVEYLARELRRARRRAGALLRRAARRAGRHRVRRAGRRWPAPTPRCARMGVDLEMAAGCAGADVVHSHTWYANLAGHVAKLLHGVPHVVTAHSLEPLRPWKAEQLGGGYALSSWCERTARARPPTRSSRCPPGMRRDVLAAYPAVDPDRVRVVHNGIDTGAVRAGPGHRRAGPARHRPGPARAWSSSAGSPGRRACRTCCGRPGSCRPTPSSCCWPARRTPRRSPPRWRAWSAELRAEPRRRGLDRRDAAQARGDPGAHPRHGLRLPVGVRADGHRQPGGDGLRDGRGGHRHRRHPGGGRRRRDRPAGADRAGRRRHRHARWTRSGSSPTWPPPINELLADPERAAASWAGPAGGGRWSTSPGTPSPRGPSAVYRSVLGAG